MQRVLLIRILGRGIFWNCDRSRLQSKMYFYLFKGHCFRLWCAVIYWTWGQRVWFYMAYIEKLFIEQKFSDIRHISLVQSVTDSMSTTTLLRNNHRHSRPIYHNALQTKNLYNLSVYHKAFWTEIYTTITSTALSDLSHVTSIYMVWCCTCHMCTCNSTCKACIKGWHI